MEALTSPLIALATAHALRKADLVAKADKAHEPPPLRLPGCVVSRRYELTPRRRGRGGGLCHEAEFPFRGSSAEGELSIE